MYQELVNQIFLDRHEDREPDGRLHPSSLSECDRLAVYVARGEPVSNVKDVRFIRIMGTGTSIHDMIQGALARRDPATLLEVRVDYGPVHGSADALLPVGDGGNEYITVPVYELQEFKSISPNGKRYLKGKPRPEHADQARMYYWGLEGMGYLLDGIRIVYFDRDDFSVLEFEVEPWDEEEVGAFEVKLDDLNNHIEEGTLPDPMPDSFWLCKMCSYRTVCKGMN